MISRLALSALLFSAGVLHLVRPEVFDPAIPFGPKFEINVFAGILEIALAAGLWFPRLADHAARLSALWFIVLIPVHLYVSWYRVPIFGVDAPLILWGRTLLQPLLIFWALSLQRDGWLISQRWTEVLFLHYEADPEELQRRVPYPLDLYHGKAIVSVVPFVMGNIRFPFLPAIPGLSRLLELNLRTYVQVDGRPAVYFLTLDSNHLPGILIARLAFSLPYRFQRMSLGHGGSYDFKASRLRLKAQVEGTTASSEFDRWATERYALVTRRWGQDYLGVVEHRPWELRPARVLELDDRFSTHYLSSLKLIGAAYAQKLDVRFRPFTPLATTPGRQHDQS
jgi:uncharacterized protein YqjF (DUF2071 family)